MKSTLLSVAFAVSILISAHSPTLAQGCVAVRNLSNGSSLTFDSLSERSWEFSVNYRYFKSFRHFVGSEEQKQRVEQNTNVINHDNSAILGAFYTLNRRWSFSASVPFMYIDRSHNRTDPNTGAKGRHYTTSKGLGDMRLSAYYSVIPGNSSGYLLAGLGFKLPTGNDNYKDEAFQKDGTYDLEPVDQSQQPGDGGFGPVLEVDFSHTIMPRLYGYINGLYVINPRNTNGTLTGRGNPFEQVMSVVDQYYLRVGGRLNFGGFQAGLGARLEGIPVHDLIGKSEGFRRPGYIVSLEPALLYSFGNNIVSLNVPIALYRNRTQSVPDKELEAQEGQTEHGDAAFADYLISVSYAYRLPR